MRYQRETGVHGILTETERRAIYESYSTRTIIRAASRISDDAEIVVGSQAIPAQDMKLPPIAYKSEEANVYPRYHTECADDIDFAIGEVSSFHPVSAGIMDNGDEPMYASIGVVT